MEVESKLTIGLGVGTLVALAALLYWVLGTIAPETSDTTYWVEFQRPISGLAVNAAVSMRGVPVGRVGAIDSRTDDARGFISRVQLVITRKDVPLWADGKPVIREVDNPALLDRDGLGKGDTLIALLPVGDDGSVGAPVPLPDAETAQRALAEAARGDGHYLLRVDRLGDVRELAFAAGQALEIELEAEEAPAQIAAARGVAAARQGLYPRDEVLRIGARSVGSVVEAEQELLALAARLDPRSTATFAVRRRGHEEPLVVPISGRDGPAMLTFWHRGTRVQLETNLVTGIKTVYLTGAKPAGPDGPVDTAEIAIGEMIPADEDDLFAQLTELVRRRVPVLVHRTDTLLARANEAAAETTLAIRDARGLLKDASRWTAEGGKVDVAFDEVNGILADVRGYTRAGGQFDKLVTRANELAAKDGDLGVLLHDAREELKALAERTRTTLDRVNAQLAEDGDIARMMANVREMTEDGPNSTRGKVDALIARLDRTIQETERQVLGNGRLQSLIDNLDHAVRRELRTALTQISASMQTFKQTLIQMQSNPDSIFLGKRRPQ